jgi:hypothetical protein
MENPLRKFAIQGRLLQFRSGQWTTFINEDLQQQKPQEGQYITGHGSLTLQ